MNARGGGGRLPFSAWTRHSGELPLLTPVNDIVIAGVYIFEAGRLIAGFRG